MPSAALTAEERFVRFAETGDSSILDQLLAEHLDRAYSQAIRFLGNTSDAEDVVQDAFITAVKKARQFDPAIPFAAWLSRIVHYTSLDALRSRRRRNHRETEARVHQSRDSQESASAESQHPAGDDLREAVRALPRRSRTMVDLHYYAGLSQLDTAKALGVSENAVAKALQRAREELRALLTRRGVAISSVAIASTLAALPAHAAPSTLRNAIVFTKAAAASSATAGIGALIGVKTVAALAVTASVAVGGGVWLKTSSSPAASTPISTLDFESQKQVDDLKADAALDTTMSHRWLEHGGVDDSGCLEVTVRQSAMSSIYVDYMLLDTPIDRLPVVVEYDLQFANVDNPAGFGSVLSWSEDDGCVRFDRAWPFSDILTAEPRLAWQHITTYVSDRAICTMVDGKRYMAAVVQRQPQAKLCLALYGNLRIDNLTIGTTTPESLPDLSSEFAQAEQATIPNFVFRYSMVAPSAVTGPGTRMTVYNSKRVAAQDSSSP